MSATFTAANSVLCKTCQETYYNPFVSASFEKLSRKVTVDYGKGFYTGFVSSERVCLYPDLDNTCMDDFHFIMVTDQSGLGNAPGMLGMSPPKNQVHDLLEENSATCLVKSLFK